MLDVVIFTLVGVATVGLALFGVLYGSHRLASVWLMFGCVVVYALAACLYWQEKIVANESLYNATSLTLKVTGALVSSGGNAVLYVKHDIQSGTVVSPMPIAFGVALTSTAPAPLELDRISMSVRDGDGPWEQLRSIRISQQPVYWAYDPRNALVLTFSTTLDEALEGKLVKPNEPIRGWMFFEYPSVLKDFGVRRLNLTWRFDAEDSAGRKYSSQVVVPSGEAKGSTTMNSSSFGTDGRREDLTVYPRVPFSTPWIQ